MGKFPYMYTDSEETDDTASSIENVRKKKKFSILKYTSGNLKKKKCKVHSKSEPDDSDFRSASKTSQKGKRKLQGILKHDRDREDSSDEDEDSEPLHSSHVKESSKYLVGRVPRPVGGKPGRGGGLALIIQKDYSVALQPQQSGSKRRKMGRLVRKRSY